MATDTVVSALAFAVAMVVAAPVADAAAPGEGEPFTVGDLAVRLAGELHLKGAAPDPQAAREALAAAGVTITGDLERTLREKDVAEILNQLGLHLTTSKPERPVDGVKVDRLLELMFRAPQGDSTSDRGNNPPGGGFGRSKSQASPHNR